MSAEHSKLGSRIIGSGGTGATLVDGGLVIVGSVEYGRLLVWALGEEARDDILALQVVGWELGEVEDGGVVGALGWCFG